MNHLIEGFLRTKLQDNDEDATPSYTDRSTWAEVVGRKNEEEESYEEENHNGRKNKSEFKRSEHDYNQQDQQNEVAADSDGWETVGGRQHRPPNKQYQDPTDQWQGYKRPSEHSYGSEVGNDIDIEPTEEELSDLSKACRRLWELDLNRLVPGQDYEISCGEGKRPYQEGDVAENAFFRWVNKDVFRRPTFSRFYVLLDNYNPSQGSSEVVTSEEKQETMAFIEEISRTAPIKYLHKYLVANRLASHNYEAFKRSMKSLWFDLLDRSGANDSSSAFEHVFVGEVKRSQVKEVSGFHNWIQFYLEEAKGRIDYQGYIYPRRRGQFPDSESQLLTVQFTWNGVLKSVSSTFIGVSPEFEIALYTLCFFVGREDNYIELGPYDVNVKCYRLDGNKVKIALCQLSVTTDKERNIAHARAAIEAAADGGAQLVVLPEIWNGPYSNESFPVYAEDIDAGGSASPSTTMLSEVSRSRGITIIGGSISERSGDLLYNTCCVFGKDGELKAKHRKIHLFDIDIPGKISFKESKTLTAGNSPTVVETDVGRIGIGICYDIRFQELAMLYAARGAHLICYPGAFNMTTGPLHWELLQRARAVDNQLYVATCSPARDASAGYVAWGHSTIVGPFGEVIATTEHEEVTIIADIDFSEIEQRRMNLPLEKQQRGDLYQLVDIGRLSSENY